jgi:hypothetical protein
LYTFLKYQFVWTLKCFIPEELLHEVLCKTIGKSSYIDDVPISYKVFVKSVELNVKTIRQAKQTSISLTPAYLFHVLLVQGEAEDIPITNDSTLADGFGNRYETLRSPA